MFTKDFLFWCNSSALHRLGFFNPNRIDYKTKKLPYIRHDHFVQVVDILCEWQHVRREVVETGCSKLSEIADYITDLKQQIENMVIPAKITPDSFDEVKKRVDDLIQQTNQLLERHRLQQRQEWNVQNDHLKSIIRNNKGVWLSNKVFWWTIGIFEVAVCLAIYFGGNALVSAIR
ncbi:MAG: hypothetical protein Q4E32_03700 [Bacteroidales bacterium]|nr:hypothetical protein [Bacteroidales bacterium]